MIKFVFFWIRIFTLEFDLFGNEMSGQFELENLRKDFNKINKQVAKLRIVSILFITQLLFMLYIVCFCYFYFWMNLVCCELIIRWSVFSESNNFWIQNAIVFFLDLVVVLGKGFANMNNWGCKTLNLRWLKSAFFSINLRVRRSSAAIFIFFQKNTSKLGLGRI